MTAIVDRAECCYPAHRAYPDWYRLTDHAPLCPVCTPPPPGVAYAGPLPVSIPTPDICRPDPETAVPAAANRSQSRGRRPAGLPGWADWD